MAIRRRFRRRDWSSHIQPTPLGGTGLAATRGAVAALTRAIFQKLVKLVSGIQFLLELLALAIRQPLAPQTLEGNHPRRVQVGVRLKPAPDTPEPVHPEAVALRQFLPVFPIPETTLRAGLRRVGSRHCHRSGKTIRPQFVFHNPLELLVLAVAQQPVEIVPPAWTAGTGARETQFLQHHPRPVLPRHVHNGVGRPMHRFVGHCPTHSRGIVPTALLRRALPPFVDALHMAQFHAVHVARRQRPTLIVHHHQARQVVNAPIHTQHACRGDLLVPELKRDMQFESPVPLQQLGGLRPSHPDETVHLVLPPERQRKQGAGFAGKFLWLSGPDVHQSIHLDLPREAAVLGVQVQPGVVIVLFRVTQHQKPVSRAVFQEQNRPAPPRAPLPRQIVARGALLLQREGSRQPVQRGIPPGRVRAQRRRRRGRDGLLFLFFLPQFDVRRKLPRHIIRQPGLRPDGQRQRLCECGRRLLDGRGAFQAAQPRVALDLRQKLRQYLGVGPVIAGEGVIQHRALAVRRVVNAEHRRLVRGDNFFRCLPAHSGPHSPRVEPSVYTSRWAEATALYPPGFSTSSDNPSPPPIQMAATP
ncbi:MAG: hypothetical protein OEW11_06395 [Nitrospirota bacterium]|nr:hypothetical protein [Nitrospirota bacterium]